MAAIKGVWKNPTKSRCDVKRAYPSMAIAEARANRATRRAGHLIIAYKCFDCGAFHIGHPDLVPAARSPQEGQDQGTTHLCPLRRTHTETLRKIHQASARLRLRHKKVSVAVQYYPQRKGKEANGLEG